MLKCYTAILYCIVLYCILLLQEYFVSMGRDISMCAQGNNVESITGDQINKAVYTVKPPEGLGM